MTNNKVAEQSPIRTMQAVIVACRLVMLGTVQWISSKIRGHISEVSKNGLQFVTKSLQHVFCKIVEDCTPRPALGSAKQGAASAGTNTFTTWFLPSFSFDKMHCSEQMSLSDVCLAFTLQGINHLCAPDLVGVPCSAQNYSGTQCRVSNGNAPPRSTVVQQKDTMKSKVFILLAKMASQSKPTCRVLPSQNSPT